ncbi:putative SGNH hydrolase superfamily [Helianthus annuus]|nr:putative SGNH hydrolase superfamily [Helianthus annuus]
MLMSTSSTPPVATTVFFGANDAALTGRYSERQHVPLEEYKENLRKIVRHLKVTHLTISLFPVSVQSTFSFSKLGQILRL